MIAYFLLTLIILGLGAVACLEIAIILTKNKKNAPQIKQKSYKIGMGFTYFIGIGAIISIMGIMIWFVPIREASKQYNLTTIKVYEEELPTQQQAVEDDYIELSDIAMHYVKYGTKGHDVILIHGNGGSADSLKGLAMYLANDYTVYCIDDRCQGKSSDPGVITYELMAKDVNEFIIKKGLDKPYIMGHSDGGMVGIALASNYPDSLGALVSCGSNSNPNTFNWEFTFGVQMNNFRSPNKLNNLMLTEPNFTPEYLARITAPTVIVAGEFDIMPLSDSVYIHQNIKNSEITIMKWGDHSSYFGANQEKIYVFIKAFFDKNSVD